MLTLLGLNVWLWDLNLQTARRMQGLNFSQHFLTIQVLWYMMQCHWASGSQHSGRMQCLHLEGSKGHSRMLDKC